MRREHRGKQVNLRGQYFMRFNPWANDLPLGADARITGIVPCIRYLLHDGRNAWHSTWSQHYLSPVSSRTLQEAKNKAEQNRKSGSVFYIRQSPVLTVEAGPFRLMVYEVNSNNPFTAFDADPRQNDVGDSGQRKPPLVLAEHETLTSIARKLSAEGGFWRSGWSVRKNLIFEFGSGLDIGGTGVLRAESLPESPLKAWKSSSQGAGYYLSWHESASQTSPAGVSELVASLNVTLRETQDMRNGKLEHPQVLFRMYKSGRVSQQIFTHEVPLYNWTLYAHFLQKLGIVDKVNICKMTYVPAGTVVQHNEYSAQAIRVYGEKK
ncbi:hypothetical protein PQQ72_15905 [Paraburkholderia strydomiana]|uniref:hypothetical protein n=1 Tax=Paraburkholderia strydomiana TaxID=1245417 RepID=UPI0038B7078B